MVWAVLAALLLSGPQGSAPASGNECATCHLRNAWTQSVTTHVDMWITSRHAFYRVGCEKCHGGDARTTDQRIAHRGVLNSAARSSPVSRTAQPATCGRCHRREANAFEGSAHRALLSQAETSAPTCTSCHSSMASDVLSPAALETQCRQCHHGDPQNRAGTARREVEALARLRLALRRAKLEIDITKDEERKASLTKQSAESDRILRDGMAALHRFDQSGVEDRLSEVRSQIDRLRAAVAGR